MMKKIEIVTEALRIRQFTPGDRDGLYELTCQSEITDYLPDWKMTLQQLNEFLEYVISSYASFNPEDVRYLLAVEHKEDGRLIGWCGVFPNTKLPPDTREIAYAVSTHDRNQGYGDRSRPGCRGLYV